MRALWDQGFFGMCLIRSFDYSEAFNSRGVRFDQQFSTVRFGTSL